MPTLVLSLALVLLLGVPCLVLFHVGRGRREQAREAGMYAAMFEGNRSVKLVVDPGTGAIVDANSAAVRFSATSAPGCCRCTSRTSTPSPRRS
jgi:hypothetical protein